MFCPEKAQQLLGAGFLYLCLLMFTNVNLEQAGAELGQAQVLFS